MKFIRVNCILVYLAKVIRSDYLVLGQGNQIQECCLYTLVRSDYLVLGHTKNCFGF